MNYAFKLVMAVLDTPFIYAGVALIRCFLDGEATLPKSSQAQ